MSETSAAVADPVRSPGGIFSLAEIVLILLRYRFCLEVAGAVALVLSAATVFLIPNQYTARASILTPQQNAAGGLALLAQAGSAGGAASAASALGLKNPNDLYVAMLHSSSVEQAMVERLHLRERYHKALLSQACKKLESHSSVDSTAKDGLIRIAWRDGDPRFAAEAANAYIEELRRFSGTLAVTEAAQRRLFFETQLAGTKNELNKAEDALKAAQQKSGMVEPDSQSRVVIESAAVLRAHAAAKQVQIEAMRQFAAEQNPELLVAERELAGLRAQLAAMGAGAGGGDLVLPRGNLPEASLEYLRRLRDVKYNETAYGLLAQQLEVAKVDEARQGVLIQVVDPATVPDRKSFPPRLLIIVGSVFLVLVLTSLFLILRESLRVVLRDPWLREKIEQWKVPDVA